MFYFFAPKCILVDTVGGTQCMVQDKYERPAPPPPPPRPKGNKMRTDKERLDFLQKLTDDAKYTGNCILRDSTTGRGWRMGETSWAGSVPDVREAIDNYMDEK